MVLAEVARRGRPGVALVLLFLVSPAIADDRPDGVLSIPGRVLEVRSKKPIADVQVVVERRVARVDAREVPKWAGEERLKTDSDGRFTLRFPPEQQQEPRLTLVVRLAHPNYIRRASIERSFAQFQDIFKANKAFFEEIVLEPGVIYNAEVVKPDGAPASGVKYDCTLICRGLQNEFFAYDAKGESDPQGLIRLRLPRTEGLALFLTPDESLAQFQKYWGPENFNGRVRYLRPNLGRLALEKGESLTGRVLDASGKPIIGVKLEATGRGTQDRRETTTGADGRFTFKRSDPQATRSRRPGKPRRIRRSFTRTFLWHAPSRSRRRRSSS